MSNCDRLADDDTSDDDLEPNSCSPYDERDLVDGYVLRMNAYRAAWDKCLDRIQVRILTRSVAFPYVPPRQSSELYMLLC